MTLLMDLERAGVRFQVVGDRLRVKGPKGRLTPDVVKCLSAHKAELLTELLQRPLVWDLPEDPLDWPEDWLDRFVERAAIMQYDGGLTRVEAEKRAEVLVRELYRLRQGERA